MRLSGVSGVRGVCGMAALLTCFATCAVARTLTLAVGAPVTSIDPHYHNLTPNNALAAHIFDRLVDRDPDARPIPGLAESWKLVDEHTWEFRLRDVKFHDGSPFTAEDVAYTLRRVPRVKNSPSSFSAYTSAVTEVEVVDPHTIRLRTANVYPLLPVDLTQVAIISHRIGPDPATEDFNSGKDAIGTGPFRLPTTRRAPRHCSRATWSSSTRCRPAMSACCAGTRR